MKNKDKPKTKSKKPEPKKQVKRPAHKKPRPKKYVEARTPKQTKKTQEAVVAKEAPPDIVEALTTVDVFAESPPVPGVIRRHPYKDEKTGKDEYVETEPGRYVRQPLTDSTYIRMLQEEEEASRAETAKAREADHKISQSKPGLFTRLLRFFNI
jgi:hypothetical protein